jgi:hypothetical protein
VRLCPDGCLWVRLPPYVAQSEPEHETDGEQ